MRSDMHGHTHCSRFGRFGARLWAVADCEGYVRVRPADLERLRGLPEDELERLALVEVVGLTKNAALVVLAERAVDKWRAGQCA